MQRSDSGSSPESGGNASGAGDSNRHVDAAAAAGDNDTAAAEDDDAGDNDGDALDAEVEDGDYWDEEDELAIDFQRELAGGGAGGDTPAPSGATPPKELIHTAYCCCGISWL